MNRVNLIKLSILALVIAVSVAGYRPSTNASATTAALTDADKQTMLAQHNDWRARYNVPALVWDDALANFAAGWANLQAGGTVNGHRPDNQYGENIWEGTAGAYPVTDAVGGWAGEVADYNLAANTCADGKVCGHFTQVVWAGSQRVGGGKATGNGTDYIVCNYDPPGNFDGVSPLAR